MAPNFLLQEQTIRQDGVGPALALDDSPSLLTITLGITRVIEQQSLDLSIYTSPDGVTWSDKPAAAFPQKFYCGVYSLMIDLAEHAEAKYLRVGWKLNRWGRGEPTPLFSIYVFAEPAMAGVRAQAAVA